MTDKKSELVGKLMKMAQEVGKPMSESEALARVNDTFYGEAFSSLTPAPDIAQEKLHKIIEDWLNRN